MHDETNRAAPIAAQLDQDAERAAFERVYAELNHSTPGGGWNDFDGAAGRYQEEDTHDAWVFWQAARRAAPVAAQLDAELPPPQLPLPKPHMRVMEVDGSGDYPVFLTAQVLAFAQGYARQVVAPYAERIRLLERELATFKAEHATLQPDAWVYECRQPLTDPVVWAEFFGRDKPSSSAWVRNVRGLAYIDGRTAGTAADAAPKAKPPLPILYRFDRYQGACKMAEGIGVHATSMAEAIEMAREVARKTGMPTEGVEIRFANNNPCAPACRCSICKRAAAPSPQENTNEN